MKFSIVTPVYNGEKYIAETIESVLSQEGNFEIECLIQDGGSTDKTLAIARSYDERLKANTYPIHCKGITFKWFSEKDQGMYDAIEKGFAHTTGEVMAYLNADDRYLPGAFAAVSNVLSIFPEIEWVKGVNAISDETGNIISNGSCFLYRQDWLQKGIYGRSAYFVQQDSVFWRRSLWEKSRPAIAGFRLAGDYALWITFARYAPLWSFNKAVSIFRRRKGQLSEDMRAYRAEQERIAPHHFFLEKIVLLYFMSIRFLKLNPISIRSRILFTTLFPFKHNLPYIDFDSQGSPIKKLATAYVA